MSVELLALLAPKSPNLEPTPAATDGSTIGPQDVAAALSHMPALFSSLLLTVYQHEKNCRPWLMNECAFRIKQRQEEMFHGKHAARILQKLVDVVLRDLEHPVQCQYCLGRGVVYDLDDVRDCKECKNGRVKQTLTRLAREVGVTRAAWYRHWDNRHKAVSHEIGGWLAEAETRFCKEMRKV